MRFIVDAAEADVTASGQIEVGWAVHRLFFRLCLGVGIFGCGSLTSEERKRNVDGGVLADPGILGSRWSKETSAVLRF